jgi:hypothetical protein
MHTNGNNIEHIEFITFIKAARQRSSTAAQLRHENAGLLQIIADFDARLAAVEAERDVIADTCKRTHDLCVKWQEETQKVAAERDELQQRLDSLSNIPVVELPQYRRIVRNGTHVRAII